MASGYKLVTLANGEHSVHSLAHRETFHPVIGPVAEAEALYVGQLRLRERLARHSGEFVIWDVGLGAAANSTTVLKATSGIACPLRVLSFDHTLEPLEFALAHRDALPFLKGYEDHLVSLTRHHATEFVASGAAGQKVHWTLHLGDFPSLLASPAAESLPKPHAILFDAFSPAKNPAMWTLPLFTRLYQLLDPQRPCALPTYSRSTLLRVTLLLAGFFVGVGHATGEKEETTIAANTLGLVEEPLGREWLERVRRSTSAEPLHAAEYRQRPLQSETRQRLEAHTQFT